MTEKNKKTSSGDRAIGMDASITRRDFLGSALLASGATALNGLNPAQILATAGAPSAVGARDDWTGYGGVGEYSHSNGNAFEVMEIGHKMRDGAYDRVPANTIETEETYDCVIVGGGISGLAAALFFQRKAGKDKTCLILENHAIFGGEAKQNQFEVDGKRLVAHQGSAIYLVPYPYSFIARFYDSIGLDTPKLTYQRWSGTGPEMALSRTPYDSAGLSRGQYGFWFGAVNCCDGFRALRPTNRNLIHRNTKVMKSRASWMPSHWSSTLWSDTD
jgi:spermidine dehydrogenase